MFRAKHPADYFSIIVTLWIAIYILCNLLPQSWFLEYSDFHASDVCRDGKQELTGKRTVPFAVNAYGVDRLYSYQQEKYVDRVEWSGAYQGGTTISSWKELVTEPVGTYRWDSTTLIVELPLFIKVSINGVRTNDFQVVECE